MYFDRKYNTLAYHHWAGSQKSFKMRQNLALGICLCVKDLPIKKFERACKRILIIYDYVQSNLRILRVCVGSVVL